MPVTRRAHRRVGLVAVQADARTGQFEMNLGTVERGRGVCQMAYFGRDARGFHATGEFRERFDLPVGGGDEFRNIRRVGDRQMAPLADDVQHALMRERHQLGRGRVESGRREAVAAEAGVDLDMHACGFAEPARGVGERVDARQRADGDVDVVVRSARRTAHPCRCTPMSECGSGPGRCRVCAAAAPHAIARCPARSRRPRAPPARPAADRARRHPPLDHAHHRRAGMRAAHHIDQVGHVVPQRGQVDDRLRGVPASRRPVVGLASRG